VNKKEPVSPFFFALVYAGLNDKENALKWLEKAYEEKSGSVTIPEDGTTFAEPAQ
jgi:hypothetical protein